MKRYNVVAWGAIGVTMPSEFTDYWDTAKSIHDRMLKDGAASVLVYDTQDGRFVQM